MTEFQVRTDGKIFNPVTKRLVNDTPENRKKVAKMVKESSASETVSVQTTETSLLNTPLPLTSCPAIDPNQNAVLRPREQISSTIPFTMEIQLLAITPPEHLLRVLKNKALAQVILLPTSSLHSTASFKRPLEYFTDGKHASYQFIPIIPEIKIETFSELIQKEFSQSRSEGRDREATAALKPAQSRKTKENIKEIYAGLQAIKDKETLAEIERDIKTTEDLLSSTSSVNDKGVTQAKAFLKRKEKERASLLLKIKQQDNEEKTPSSPAKSLKFQKKEVDPTVSEEGNVLVLISDWKRKNAPEKGFGQKGKKLIFMTPKT